MTDLGLMQFSAAEIKARLQAVGQANGAEKRMVLQSFFKTAPGQYGQGDLFLGVSVPQVRALLKEYRDVLGVQRGGFLCHEAFGRGGIPYRETLQGLLDEPYHECRLFALLALVQWSQQLEKRWNRDKARLQGKEAARPVDVSKDPGEILYRFYMENAARVNNWDLVDLTAPSVVGAYLLRQGNPADLLSYARSSHLWTQRIAMVSTFAFLKAGDAGPTYAVADLLLYHPHDLIQKAVGWMLREAGKRVSEAGEIAYLSGSAPVPAGKGEFCEPFIRKQPARRYEVMPRAMLRYAVERLPAGDRSRLLSR